MEVKRLLTHRVSQNAFASMVRTVLQIVIGFVGNYFVVRFVSPENLGIWALTFTFASFLNLADMGVSTALIRFIANKEKKRSQYFWTTIYFYLLTGLIGGLILLVLQKLFGSYFFKEVTPDLLFILLSLLGAYGALLSSTVTNAFNGLQLMHYAGSLEVLKSFSYYTITLLALPSLGIYSFALALIASNLLAFTIGWGLLTKHIQLPFMWPDLATAKELFTFGSKSYGIQIINQLKGAYLKLLTSRLFAIEYVAFVDLTQKIAGYFRQFLLSIVVPLMPAASEYHAKKQTEKIKRLYWTSLGALFGVGTAMTVSFIVAAPFIISLWLGPEYSPVVAASQLISVAVLFNLLTGPGFSILQAIDKQKPLLFTSFIGLITFAVLTSVFALSIGFNGIFVGNIVAEFVVGSGFLWWIWSSKPMTSTYGKAFLSANLGKVADKTQD